MDKEEIVKKVRELIQSSESNHFAIPDQAYRRSEQHNLVSLGFVKELLDVIDNEDELFDTFYIVKNEISKQL